MSKSAFYNKYSINQLNIYSKFYFRTKLINQKGKILKKSDSLVTRLLYLHDVVNNLKKMIKVHKNTVIIKIGLYNS